jgi:hypothetical protein
MDVPEDNTDIKLYRASADLLPEIQAKLPKLIRHSSPEKYGRVRRWVLDSKTYEVIQRVSL